MIVQMLLKDNKNKQIGIIADNKSYCLNTAIELYNNKLLDNVVLVDNKFFRAKSGNLPVKEVYYDERNEGHLGKIQQGKSKSSRCNTKRSSRLKNKVESDGRKHNDRRGEICQNSVKSSRPIETSSSSGQTFRDISLHLKKCGCRVCRLSNAKTFNKEFSRAKKAIDNGICVDEHSVEELSQMKLLRSSNGFIAVEKSGNINSVLRDTSKPKKKNFLRDMLLNAIAHGGTKLDCFAITEGNSTGGLADMYCKYGFIPAVKDKFNTEFAPDNWNYERDGKPDIVFMYFCGDTIEEVIKKSGKGMYPKYFDYDIPYIEDTDKYKEWIKDKSNEEIDTYSFSLNYRDWVQDKHLRLRSL